MAAKGARRRVFQSPTSCTPYLTPVPPTFLPPAPYLPPTYPLYPLHTPWPVLPQVRTGETEKKINVRSLVPLLHEAGAAAVTVHGRTMEQR